MPTSDSKFADRCDFSRKIRSALSWCWWDRITRANIATRNKWLCWIHPKFERRSHTYTIHILLSHLCISPHTLKVQNAYAHTHYKRGHRLYLLCCVSAFSDCIRYIVLYVLLLPGIGTAYSSAATTRAKFALLKFCTSCQSWTWIDNAYSVYVCVCVCETTISILVQFGLVFVDTMTITIIHTYILVLLSVARHPHKM